MSDADKNRQLDEYFAWQPHDDPEFAGLIYGKETIGGKGRSLLYGLRKLRDSGDEQLAASLVPESIYFGIDLFRQFLDSVPGLDSLIAHDDPEQLECVFLQTPLPEVICDAVRRFLAEIQVPIVVRSSSRLEDSVVHSFAGKYRSTFLLNDDPSLDKRAHDVEEEIKRIYARIYFPKAISYRLRHELGGDDMGIILMRMSGHWRGPYYYPTMAGVGYSQNYRRWNPRLRQEDGVLRIVFGMGTMSTKRGYARTFSLTNPNLRPEGNNPEKVAFHAQENFHVVDPANGTDVTTIDVKKQWRHLIKYHPDFDAFAQVYHYDAEGGYFTSLDCCMMKLEAGTKICFTFENFPRKYPRFFPRMKNTLSLLENVMGVPADIEFAYNPLEDRLVLIQSRPFWSPVFGDASIPDLTGCRTLLHADRMVTPGRIDDIRTIVYVDDVLYYSNPDFYSVARGIGDLNKKGEKYILVAPGRVGSSNPELGVPVQYNELTNCRCIVELGIPRLGFMPELSYGTHFFSDLAVDNVLYMPVFEGEGKSIFSRDWFDHTKWEPGPEPALRVYHGHFSAYLDGDKNEGYIVERPE